MPTVSVPPSFFVAERNSVYSDWHSAFWRELLSNALDAGASRVRIRTRVDQDQLTVDVIDNGSGMTRDIVENVYMSLGASTKAGGENDGIGGFGRARILTCFSQDSYRIRTSDIVVTGQGASYEVAPCEPVVKGCALSIRMPDHAAFWIHKGLEKVLRQSSLRCSIELNLQSKDAEGYDLYKLDEKLLADKGDGWQRFRGWSHKGRQFDTLSDEKGPWASLHVSEGTTANSGSAIIRVNGMAMYEEMISAPVQVTADLVPERAREILTASRDSIRGDFRHSLQGVFSRISSEKTSAFKGKSHERERSIATSAKFGLAGLPIPGPRKIEAQKAVQAMVTEASIPRATETLRNSPADIRRVSASMIPRQQDQEAATVPEHPYGLLYPVAIFIDNPHPAQRAVIERYKGDTWIQPGAEGRNAELLHGAWTAACRVAISGLLEQFPAMRDHPSMTWVSGFVFDRDMRACHTQFGKINHGLLVNPVDDAGRMRFKISDPQSLKVLATEAIHEVTHIATRWHDEDFARIMTTLVASIRDRDMETAMRSEMGIVREWQQARKAHMDLEVGLATMPESQMPQSRAETEFTSPFPL